MTLSETSPGYGRFSEARESRRDPKGGAGTLARSFFARSDLRLPGFRRRPPGKDKMCIRDRLRERGSLPATFYVVTREMFP